MSMSMGTVVQVIGPVVDVEYSRDNVPKINDALKQVDGDLVFEVQQQLGDGVVRTIAMGTTGRQMGELLPSGHFQCLTTNDAANQSTGQNFQRLE